MAQGRSLCPSITGWAASTRSARAIAGSSAAVAAPGTSRTNATKTRRIIRPPEGGYLIRPVAHGPGSVRGTQPSHNRTQTAGKHTDTRGLNGSATMSCLPGAPVARALDEAGSGGEMDRPRIVSPHRKRIRQAAYAGGALALLLVTLGLSRLKPAAP